MMNIVKQKNIILMIEVIIYVKFHISLKKKNLKYNPKLPEPYDKPYEIIYVDSVISFDKNKKIDDLSSNTVNIKNIEDLSNNKLEEVENTNKSAVAVDIKDIYINNTIEKMLIEKVVLLMLINLITELGKELIKLVLVLRKELRILVLVLRKELRILVLVLIKELKKLVFF